LKIPKLYVTFQRNGCEIADINEAIRWWFRQCFH
jgi:hypothetical protein